MKLRIRNNSIRVRLTRSEVARLATGERVEQATGFSAATRLVSSVELSSQIAVPSASFDGTRVSVLLPLAQVTEWANSAQVSIQAQQHIAADSVLQILVEKDFECMHSRAEGNTDTFPNPSLRETTQR